MKYKTNKPATIATIGMLAASLAFVGYKLYPFNPFSNRSMSTATSPALRQEADDDNNEITITVIKSKDEVNPLETVVAQAQQYVASHSWKEIVQQYAGVQGGVVVSLRDYQGNDREQACKLALGRFVEATLGSIVDRTNLQYRELTEAITAKGLADCMNDIKLDGCKKYNNQGRVSKDTRCSGVRFGL
ncbi:MAG: hypothetical protein Q7K45_00110 [Nanoarchaeota archaeon]|nr:hypothetical protein [Nanoarchaeota archaeon]